MKNKLLNLLVILLISITVVGCNNTQKETKEESNKTEKKETSKKSQVNKELICKKDNVSYILTYRTTIEDGKATKLVNTYEYVDDLKTWCPEIHSRYDSLNSIKGLSAEITCDEKTDKSTAVLTWNISEIESYDTLVRDQIPDQLTFMNRETSEFYYDSYLESMATRKFTCEEK